MAAATKGIYNVYLNKWRYVVPLGKCHIGIFWEWVVISHGHIYHFVLIENYIINVGSDVSQNQLLLTLDPRDQDSIQQRLSINIFPGDHNSM